MASVDPACSPNAPSSKASSSGVPLPNDSFCKTYDFRGTYGSEATEEKCFRLGVASNAFRRPVVLGMDYREHNDSLAQAFLQGFQGVVRFAGVVPSPVIGFNASAWGVVFTASHNPTGYNGVKFKKHHRCFFEGELAKLREWYFFSKKPFEFDGKPLPEVDASLRQKYVDALPEVGSGVFDLAGGAVCALRDVFPQTLFAKPDPTYSMHAPEPKSGTLDVLQKTSVDEKKVGFAFDGDGDRCVVVDQGAVVDGGILSAFIASNHLPKKSRVLVTLDMQAEVFRFLQDQGFAVSYAPVGDVYLLEEMLSSGADFAAERSGHYSFKKHMPDSDGIFTAALLSGTRFGEVAEFAAQFKQVSLKDEVRFAVDFAKLKALVQEKAVRVDALDGVKAEFEDFTFLVRASKTEPKVRVNVEADSKELAKKGLKFLRGVLATCRV